MFHLQFLLAALVLSLLGHCIGWLLSLAFKLEYEDRLAIAIETTVQNMDIFNSTMLYLHSVPLITSLPMMCHLISDVINSKYRKNGFTRMNEID